MTSVQATINSIVIGYDKIPKFSENPKAVILLLLYERETDILLLQVLSHQQFPLK